jgi:hypothetical protein
LIYPSNGVKKRQNIYIEKRKKICRLPSMSDGGFANNPPVLILQDVKTNSQNICGLQNGPHRALD